MAFSTVFSDDFVGAAGTTLAGRTGWTEVHAASNGKRAELDGAGSAGSKWFPFPSSVASQPVVRISAAIAAKQRVTVTLAAASPSPGGMLFAWDAASDSGYLQTADFGGNKQELFRVDNGTKTSLGFAGVILSDFTAGLTRMRSTIDPASGAITLEVDRNGDGTWTTELTVTDTTYTGGGVGLAFEPATAAQFADFLAEQEAGSGGVTGTSAATLGATGAAAVGTPRLSGALSMVVAAMTGRAQGLPRLAGGGVAASGAVRMGGAAIVRLVATATSRLVPLRMAVTASRLRVAGAVSALTGRLAVFGGPLMAGEVEARRLRMPPARRRLSPGAALRLMKASSLRRLLRP